MVTLESVGAFTASLSWTRAGSVVDSYEVMWQRDTSAECSDEDEGSATITDGSLSYVINDLFGVSDYSITVSATNEVSTAVSEELPITTTEAGSQHCVCGCVHHSTLSTAPSAGPSITIYDVVPRSFSVQWGMVPCIHRNGDITGYSVQYGEVESGIIYTESMENADIFNTSFSGVIPDTMYSVEVAGVNSNGVGVYQSIIVTTPQSQQQ